MPYIKLKKEKIDRCNICLEIKKLSWDHIPPQGGIIVTPVEIRSIYEQLAGKANEKYELSQNGVKYRTICGDCNSILGREYDKILNEFNRTIASFLSTQLILPKIIHVKTKPIRLIKAILGHIAAAKTVIDDVELDKQIRRLILDKTEPIPTDINVFYWIYPYDSTVIMRDFGTLINSSDNRSFAVCDLIKYFPLAFIITDKQDFRGLDSLGKYRELQLDNEAEIRINLSRVENYNWPEKVDDNNMIFLSTETQKGISARRRK